MNDLTDSPTVLAGRYLLQREIGRGGMGAVYLARDLKHDSRVAVKLLGDGFGSAGSVDRFLAEVRTTARLNHPHILTVHDSGEVDGELYYVMPHVEGASLRERLERETRLPIVEALRIACQVGSALAYAHAHGVIHRDVKPDNILLDPRGHPYVMDFGLARALSSVTAGRATARGIAVGSPHYMSPEQAAGEAVDGRSDIYALGCVLFEMLAGEPPFPGPNAQAVLHRHLTEPPPSLKARRADIPDALERTVCTALAKQADERQVSADQLVHEIEAVLDSLSGRAKTESRPPAAPSYPRRIAIVIAAVVVAGGALVWAVASDAPRLWLGGAPPDSASWLIMPLQWSDGSEPTADRAEDRHLYAAFDRWADLDVVDRLTVSEEVEERGGARALTASVGFDLARNLDAGRLVQGLATRLGDSIQIDLTVSDVGGERRPISQLSMRVPADGSSHPHYALAADSLVFGRVTWSDGPEWDIGTHSATARQAYGAARDALDRWDVARADSLFRFAIDRDPSFARAHFWSAQLVSWTSRPNETWLPSARFALDRIANLATRERLLAAGLVALGEGRHPDACESYRQLVLLDDRDFAAWFGIGECLTGDEQVVRDPRTLSGWRFRSSYHSGVEAYVEAFRLEPGSFRLFTEDTFERLPGQILFTRENVRRQGFSADGRRFSARPQWLADSLMLVPFAHPRGQPHPDPALAGTEEALLQHRLVFRNVTRGWSAAFQRDSHVLQAVALSLECLGDEAALDTLLLARRLAHTPSHRLELAVREVWLRVRLDGADDTDLVAARVLADSILDAPDARARLAPGAMAALAVLVGRPSLAADHSGRDAPVVRSEYPSSIARPAAKLLAYAAVGAPAESIASYAALTRRAIANGLPADDRDAAHRSLLERPLILAFDRTGGWRSATPGDYQLLLSRGQAMLAGGDTAGALATLLPYRLEPGGTLDMAFSAAALATLAGDTATAIANLDAVFEDLRWMHPRMVEEVGHAGALVRAMALRAELASSADDASAERWAASVNALWGDGEPAVAPVIAAMRRIAN